MYSNHMCVCSAVAVGTCTYFTLLALKEKKCDVIRTGDELEKDMYVVMGRTSIALPIVSIYSIYTICNA